MSFNLTEIQPTPGRYKASPNRSSFWFIGIVSVLTLLLIGSLFLKGCDVKPGPNPGPTPDVDGIHVMIIEDTTEHKNLTPAQQGIFTSQELIEWAEQNCQKYEDPDFTAFLKIDKDDDLNQFPPIFNELKNKTIEKHPGVPAIGILTPEGFDAQRLPEDKDRTLQLLESIK